MLLFRTPPTRAALSRRWERRGEKNPRREGPKAAPQPHPGALCRQMAVEPWGAPAHLPAGFTPKCGRGRRRVLRRAGAAAGRTLLVPVPAPRLAVQQPRSAAPASAANPWPRGGCSPGETEAPVGKAGTGRRSLALPPEHLGVLWVPPPGTGSFAPGSYGAGSGAAGAACPPRGSQVPWQGSGTPGAAGAALARGSFGGRWRLASPEPAQRCGVHGGHRLGWGTRPRGGGPGKAPPRLCHPLPGAATHAGQGEAGRKRLPAGLDAGYKGGPESPSGMRWRPARFPRRPRLRKYTRSWWRLPQ